MSVGFQYCEHVWRLWKSQTAFAAPCQTDFLVHVRTRCLYLFFLPFHLFQRCPLCRTTTKCPWEIQTVFGAPKQFHARHCPKIRHTDEVMHTGFCYSSQHSQQPNDNVMSLFFSHLKCIWKDHKTKLETIMRLHAVIHDCLPIIFAQPFHASWQRSMCVCSLKDLI